MIVMQLSWSLLTVRLVSVERFFLTQNFKRPLYSELYCTCVCVVHQQLWICSRAVQALQFIYTSLHPHNRWKQLWLHCNLVVSGEENQLVSCESPRLRREIWGLSMSPRLTNFCPLFPRAPISPCNIFKGFSMAWHPERSTTWRTWPIFKNIMCSVRKEKHFWDFHIHYCLYWPPKSLLTSISC